MRNGAVGGLPLQRAQLVIAQCQSRHYDKTSAQPRENKHMSNPRQWLSDLSEFMARLALHPSVICMEFSVHRRVSRAFAVDELGDLYAAGAELLDPLLEFYEHAAGYCKANCLVLSPEDFTFPGFEHRTTPRHLTCGFQLLDCSGILKAREDCATKAEMLVSVLNQFGDRFGASPDLIQGHLLVLRHCIPFCELREKNVLALVPERAGVQPGVYYIFAGDSRRLCGTFGEWLNFLHESCYAGPDWAMLEFWHESNGLVLRPEITKKLMGVLGQDHECPWTEPII